MGTCPIGSQQSNFFSDYAGWKREIRFMESQIQLVPLRLANGAVVQIEARILDRKEEEPYYEEEVSDVTLKVPSFSVLAKAIEGVAQEIADALAKVAPTKASCEFGVEVGIGTGQALSLIITQSDKFNLKVILEWSRGELEKVASQPIP
jgi:hypothetical protein